MKRVLSLGLLGAAISLTLMPPASDETARLASPPPPSPGKGAGTRRRKEREARERAERDARMEAARARLAEEHRA